MTFRLGLTENMVPSASVYSVASLYPFVSKSMPAQSASHISACSFGSQISFSLQFDGSVGDAEGGVVIVFFEGLLDEIGCNVCNLVGCLEGAFVGCSVGSVIGCADGCLVGSFVGSLVVGVLVIGALVVGDIVSGACVGDRVLGGCQVRNGHQIKMIQVVISQRW